MRSSVFTPEELAKLGFDDVAAVDQERIVPPRETTEDAAGLGAVSLSLQVLLSASAPVVQHLLARLPGAEERGVQVAMVAADPRWVRLATVRGHDAIDIHFPQTGAGAASGDPGTVYWDSATQPRLLVKLPGGLAAFKRGDDGSITVELLDPSPREASTITAPLRMWAERCGDPWTASLLQRYARVGGEWQFAAGAGSLGRLYEWPSPGDVLVKARAVLRRDPGSPPVWPRLWARGLTRAQLARVDQLAVAECHAIALAIDDCASFEDTLLSVEMQHDAWLRVRHRRDDLASVSLILAEAGHVSRGVTGSLEFVDARGTAALYELGVGLAVDDERLRRARLGEPDAWWAARDAREALL